jgi:hypothetical protein
VHGEERLQLPPAAGRLLPGNPEHVRREAVRNPRETVSTAANQAQIATAVTDADCTEATDLARIYFAVQASYEQQIVNANQQALTTAVQQFRAAYAAELKKLPALLKTASAQPFGSAPAGKPTSSVG